MAVAGDIFGSEKGGATASRGVEVRDATKHPKIHAEHLPHQRITRRQNVSNAKLGKVSAEARKLR